MEQNDNDDSRNEFRMSLDSFHSDIIYKYSYFIFDCDGVLWHGRHPIPGSMQTLFSLISDPDKQVFLLSNNATLSRTDFYEKILDLFT